MESIKAIASARSADETAKKSFKGNSNKSKCVFFKFFKKIWIFFAFQHSCFFSGCSHRSRSSDQGSATGTSSYDGKAFVSLPIDSLLQFCQQSHSGHPQSLSQHPCSCSNRGRGISILLIYFYLLIYKLWIYTI